ncbi:hypothetical protein AL035_14185 [Salipiger aestuarii]|nr:hypothetical protein AL035_14185 [Salipiger aestuarii]
MTVRAHLVENPLLDRQSRGRFNSRTPHAAQPALFYGFPLDDHAPRGGGAPSGAATIGSSF